MKKIVIYAILVFHVIALEHELLHVDTGEVEASSYKYYSLTYDGFIKIQLISLIGDADLYISQTNTNPTYNPEDYCLQSTTCGEDTVLIPENFKRPIRIGVYGHPSSDVSQYTISIYALASGDNSPYADLSDNIYKEQDNKEGKLSFIVTLLWYLLDVLFQALF